MGLIINQGPLPRDGEKVDPASFLEAWIAGTTVRNLPPSAFKGGSLNYITSQTDEPTDKWAGMLWFKRGDGRLYLWDMPDLPSQLTFSDVGWICLSDRRELWVLVQKRTCAGAPLNPWDVPGGASLASDLFTTADQSVGWDDYPYRPLYYMAPATSNGSSATNTFMPWTLIANESGATGQIIRATELGWCDVVVGSGESGNSGVMVLDDIKCGYFRRMDPTCGSGCRYMPLFITADTDASNHLGEYLRYGFKYVMPLLAVDNLQ